MSLTDTELQILEIEAKRWKYAGAKDGVVMELFGMTPTRYAQVLQALIDRPEAEEAHPALVRRLRRLRVARRVASRKD